MVCVRGVPGVTETLRKSTAISTQPKRGRGTHHHVEAAVDWCSNSLLAVAVGEAFLFAVGEKFFYSWWTG